MNQLQPYFYKLFSIVLLPVLLLLMVTTAFAQQNRGTVSGHVVTNTNKPADNVSVMLKGTKYGAVTNDDGDFSFRAPQGKYTLVVSQVGSQSQEATVEVIAGKTTVMPQFTVSDATHGLQEVNINANKTNKFKRNKSVDVSKMPLNNLENASVYNSISSQLLQEQQVFSIDDAIRNASGIQKMWEATGRGGDGGAYYASRGFVVQSALRNGIAGNVTSQIDASNIDRIEIIKGPSATLFGSSLTSYGGLINRVTKKPYDSFGGEVSASAGNFDFQRVSADINMPLDAQKKVLFRLNTAYNHEGSFQNTGFNRTVAVAPSLVYNATDRLSIAVDAELFYGKSIGKPIFFFPYGVTIAQLGHNRADELPIDYKQSYMGNDLTETSRSTNFYGEVKYKISNSWTSRTNIASTHSYSDGFGPYYYLLPGDSVSRNDQSTRKSKDDMIEIQQNFNGDFKIGKFRNRFVGGLDFFRDNSNQYFFGSTLDTVSLKGNQNYSNFNKAAMDAMYATGTFGFTYPAIYIRNTYSAYVSDVFNITDQLLASAALRVDRFVNIGNYDPTTKTRYGAYQQTAFSPKFGLVYQPVKDHVSLFANYQNSFRNQTGITEDNKPLKPEHANQIEGGVKLDLFEGKLSSTISYYDIKVKDITRPSATPNRVIQDGTQLSKGIEAEVIANPIAGLNAVLGFSYNDSKYDATTNADVANRRPGTASSPYLANFWVSYRLQKGTVKGLGFGFGGNYASDNKIINSVSQGVFTLPAYTIFNASAFYDLKNYRIGTKMDNLTNQKYWIGYTTVNPQKLRNYALTFTYKF
ncbi:TonB-dependent receptor [Mucilaginibacter ginsenosidivorax]|uniref:TonB-dependent receptor n=1 Tax=Mucilaginibacter ginsenosidivorax TaxID=862126 RepID=A0A5B8W4S7_9SPHI|nr:TonB-dependent receptor [Mucilaginibacter ginsenosidivorax]QEC77348.1 TonB-dependent receptor [Mucilaginibacter ginsenosidivorax]